MSLFIKPIKRFSKEFLSLFKAQLPFPSAPIGLASTLIRKLKSVLLFLKQMG